MSQKHPHKHMSAAYDQNSLTNFSWLSKLRFYDRKNHTRHPIETNLLQFTNFLALSSKFALTESRKTVKKS